MRLQPLFIGNLVRLAATDKADHELIAQWTNNDEYMRLMDTDPARPMSKEAVDKFQEKFDNPNNYEFRIRTLADDTLIGFVALEVQWPNQNTWLAIGIGNPDYWGRGYGSDALQLALRYAFNELGVHRVTLNVLGYNTRAMRVYEKAGFTREGVLREIFYRDGKRWDMVYYGLLRHEWESGSRKS